MLHKPPPLPAELSRSHLTKLNNRNKQLNIELKKYRDQCEKYNGYIGQLHEELHALKEEVQNYQEWEESIETYIKNQTETWKDAIFKAKIAINELLEENQKLSQITQNNENIDPNITHKTIDNNISDELSIRKPPEPFSEKQSNSPIDIGYHPYIDNHTCLENQNNNNHNKFKTISMNSSTQTDCEILTSKKPSRKGEVQVLKVDDKIFEIHKKQLERCRDQNIILEKKIEITLKQLEGERSTNHSLQNSILSLQDEKQNLERQIKTLKKEGELLSSQIQNSEDIHKSLRNSINTYKTDENILLDEINDIKIKMTESSMENDKLCIQLNLCKEECRDAISNQLRAEGEIVELKEMIRQLKLSKNEEVLKITNIEKENIESKNSLFAQIKALRTEVLNLTETNEEIRRDYLCLEKEHKLLSMENAKIKNLVSVETLKKRSLLSG